MQRIDKALEIPSAIAYDLGTLCPMDQLLIIDIETTGLSPSNSALYLIGCVYFTREDERWHVRQWFLDSEADELFVLKEFIDFSKQFTHYMTYNGTTFDIPFLKSCAKSYHVIGAEAVFDELLLSHLDLYQALRPLKSLLHLENCKLKTFEQAIGLYRADIYTGYELIIQYEAYREAYLSGGKDDEEVQALKTNLLLHNEEDIADIPALLSLLNLHRMFTEVDFIKDVDVSFKDTSACLCGTLIEKLPVPLSLDTLPGIKIEIQKDQFTIQLDAYVGTLKYFFTPIKDYYYLPNEDMAVHKKVAQFVAPAYRQKATKDNCYIKQEGTYWPQGIVGDFAMPFQISSQKDDSLRFVLMDDTFKEAILDKNQLKKWAFGLICEYRPKTLKAPCDCCLKTAIPS